MNLEIESQILLNWLTTYGVLTSKPFVLILDCKMLLRQELIILPHHVFREANDAANELVKREPKHQMQLQRI